MQSSTLWHSRLSHRSIYTRVHVVAHTMSDPKSQVLARQTGEGRCNALDLSTMRVTHAFSPLFLQLRLRNHREKSFLLPFCVGAAR